MSDKYQDRLNDILIDGQIDDKEIKNFLSLSKTTEQRAQMIDSLQQKLLEG